MVISITPAGCGLQPLSLPLPSLSSLHALGMTTGKQPVLMSMPTMLRYFPNMPAWRCHTSRTAAASSYTALMPSVSTISWNGTTDSVRSAGHATALIRTTASKKAAAAAGGTAKIPLPKTIRPWSYLSVS